MFRNRLFPGYNLPAGPDRNVIAMGKLNVKNGTPVGSEHLCKSCTNGQFTTGYRESDVLVVCTNASPARLILFPVCECTDFWDRNRPGYDEMAKLALSFSEGRRKPVRGFSRVGFATIPTVDEEDVCEVDEEEDGEAARRR